MKVIYTNFLPKGTGGMALGPLVLIRPKYKDDKGIHAHEQLHVDQWREDRLGFYCKYLTNHDFRLECEVACYKKQIEVTLEQHPEKVRGALVWRFAWFIANKYRLNISQLEAAKLLE